MRILVVDDTEDNRIVIEELLRFLGHEVRSVASGREALLLLERYAPDIVVTDRRMPGMSGEELIRHIKGSKPHLHIVLMTADDLSLAERKAITLAGANIILQKPSSQEDLRRVLDEVVRISLA